MGTVVHHNYYGQPFPSPGFATAQSPFPPPYSLGQPFTPTGFPPAQAAATSSSFPPPYSNPNPPASNPNPPASATNSLRLSPPPLMPSFKEFLIFAGITPEMTKTRQILADQGINNFGRLLDRTTYTFENFRSMGIPFAHADDITKAVPDFNIHLKNLGSQNGSTLS
jgi:hypothetical protein